MTWVTCRVDESAHWMEVLGMKKPSINLQSQINLHPSLSLLFFPSFVSVEAIKISIFPTFTTQHFKFLQMSGMFLAFGLGCACWNPVVLQSVCVLRTRPSELTDEVRTCSWFKALLPLISRCAALNPFVPLFFPLFHFLEPLFSSHAWFPPCRSWQRLWPHGCIVPGQPVFLRNSIWSSWRWRTIVGGRLRTCACTSLCLMSAPHQGCPSLRRMFWVLWASFCAPFNLIFSLQSGRGIAVRSASARLCAEMGDRRRNEWDRKLPT